MTQDKHWTSWRRRRKRAGLRRVEIWIPAGLRRAFREAVDRLRDTALPKGSILLVRAVPKDLADEIRTLVDDRLASATSSRGPGRPVAGQIQPRAADDTAGHS